MEIQGISANNHNNMAFGSMVTLSAKNLGHQIQTNVIDAFNGKVWPQILENLPEASAAMFAKIAPKSDAFVKSQQELAEFVDYWALAGGSGSRFVPLAEALTAITGKPYNKISLPISIDKGQNLHMLDFAMGMGKFFTKPQGYDSRIAEVATGSFGDITQHYLQGNPIKPIVVSCGDNIFGTSAEEMTSFFVKTMNNPEKHLALVGVERAPEVVANRFGVLGVKPMEGVSDVMKLSSFAEKPSLETAQELATANGQNIANTGMFYISKDAMTRLMGDIKDEISKTGKSTIIAKNDKERWDFANAVKYVFAKIPKWFGKDAQAASDVKIVKTWEDVGEPQALYRFFDAIKKGEFLENFPKAYSRKIMDVLGAKTGDNAIVYTNRYNSLADVPKSVMDAAVEIDGRKVIG